MAPRVKRNETASAAANNAAGSLDFLDDLASKPAPENPKNKKNAARIPLSERAMGALATWIGAKQKLDELGGIIAEAEETIFAEARNIRKGMARIGREYLSSVRIGAENIGATAIWKNAYTGVAFSNLADTVSAVAENLGITAEAAKEIISQRIRWTTRLEIDNAVVDDKPAPEVIEALRVLSQHKYLKVSKVGYPTPKFHEDALLDDREEQIMSALVSSGQLRPHKPSLRVS